MIFRVYFLTPWLSLKNKREVWFFFNTASDDWPRVPACVQVDITTTLRSTRLWALKTVKCLHSGTCHLSTHLHRHASCRKYNHIIALPQVWSLSLLPVSCLSQEGPPPNLTAHLSLRRQLEKLSTPTLFRVFSCAGCTVCTSYVELRFISSKQELKLTVFFPCCWTRHGNMGTCWCCPDTAFVKMSHTLLMECCKIIETIRGIPKKVY